jgi:hypothetical protein
VNGYDYYTSGDIPYSGQWVKKAFTYLTGPAQTSMVIFIRNNAPGGGGNDWAIDDIGIAACAPNIALTPNKPDTLCQGADDTIRFKVSAFFNNYTEWKLEKSIDGGVTWISPGNDTTGALPNGSATPVYNPVSTLYEYLLSRYYRLNNVDTLVKYRLTVASTTANLSNANCAYVASALKIVRAINCMALLPTATVFKGWLNDHLATLQWISSHETGNIRYIIEHDLDNHFHQVSVIAARRWREKVQPITLMIRCPSWTDYYRINIAGSYNYSKIILLSTNGIDFEIKSWSTIFRCHFFDLTAPADAVAFVVNDAFGRPVRREVQHVNQGLNTIRINGLGNLQQGLYILQIRYSDQTISKKIIKLKQ